MRSGIQITAREMVDDCYVVTARATLPNGRHGRDHRRGRHRRPERRSAGERADEGRDEGQAARDAGHCRAGDARRVRSRDHSRRRVAAASWSTPRPAKSSPAEEAPIPPPGFYYVSGYTFNSPWHEASLVGWAADGSSLRVSTKLEGVGKLLAKADARGLPIKAGDAEITHKANRKGEAYLNKVTFYDAAQPRALSANGSSGRRRTWATPAARPPRGSSRRSRSCCRAASTPGPWKPCAAFRRPCCGRRP